MKQFILCLLVLSSATAFSQDVVKWDFTAKKVSDKTYEIHLVAKVGSPWHIYSQLTPEGGPLPTKVSFFKNPLVSTEGDVKEAGKLLTKHEEVFGVDVKFFDGTVDFVQTVKLKNKVKTTVNGSVEFMVCNDTQCLPPKVVNFSVKLE